MSEREYCREPAGAPGGAGGQFAPCERGPLSHSVTVKGPAEALDNVLRGMTPQEFVDRMFAHVYQPMVVDMSVQGGGRGDAALLSFDARPKWQHPVTTHLARSLTRRVSGRLMVSHGAFRIEKGSEQGAGFGRAALRGHFETYEAMGVESVFLTANIDVGGYAWAKWGFAPANEQDMQRLMERTRDRLALVREEGADASNPRLWIDAPTGLRVTLTETEYRKVLNVIDTAARTNKPEVFWLLSDLTVRGFKLGAHLLLGSNWSGRFDFANAKAVERMRAYAGQRDRYVDVSRVPERRKG